MISKIPKEQVVIPDSHKELLEKRKKGRAPRSYYREVPFRQMKLHVPKRVWAKFLKNKLSYELIPSSYLEIMNKDEAMPISFTDGSVVVTAVKSTAENKIDILDVRRRSMSEKEAKKGGFEWIPQTHTLFLDRNNHFLKRFQQRDFDLTLIVDAYIELKRVMPGDSVSISDGTTKILGRKLTGFTILLTTGIVIGQMNWSEFLDKRFY